MNNFVRAECVTFSEEIVFSRYVSAVERMVGRPITDNEREGIVWDIWKDGGDAEDCVGEIKE